jgi:tight adherence protein B
MNPLILIVLPLIILIILGMMAALIINNRTAQKDRALAVIKGRSASEARDKGRSEKDKRRAEIAQKLKDQTEGGKDKKNTIKNLIEQSGLKISVKRFWICCVIFSFLVVILTKILGMSPFVTLMLGITGLLGFPRMFLKWRIKRRQKKFLEEFADALEAMVRLLKSGMPVTEAIKMAGREFTGPVGEEMTLIYEAQKIGISLPDAALSAAERMPLTEMHMFATGVSIQSQTGASLSEVLTNLAGVIRARFKLKRKVQALSAEAKSSAMIIGALPFLIGSGLWFINPDYIGILFSETMGRVMLIGAGIWMCLGIFIMKAMINFKI